MTSFYIQRIKWQPKLVTISHFGPFEKREDAVEKLKRIRYNKHIDLSVVEK
jgi:hypothetical protein